MATLTASAAQPNQPRVTTDGTVISRWQTFSGTMTNGDVVIFKSIPIPHGANVHSFKIDGAAVATITASISLMFDCGFAYSGTVDYNTILGSATLSAAWSGWKEQAQNAAGRSPGAAALAPLTISVSDDAAQRFVYPKVTLNDAMPASAAAAVMKLIVKVDYSMDQ